MTDALMNTYQRLPISLTAGRGAELIDDEGRRYLDLVTGIGVTSLGHAHPAVTQAICEQAARLVHAANVAHVPVQNELAERLCRLSGLDEVFFCNSGAEALECALKLSRLRARERGVDRPLVIVLSGGFHGRTLGCISATDNSKVRDGYEPLLEGFVQVPHGDAGALARAAADPRAVAVLAEPIQGEGGVVLPPPGFLSEVRRICDQHGLLMMLDEVQTGIGKTGRWFAYQHDGVLPDVVAVAKALANGVPIGACIARRQVSALFSPGRHGSTFGGNPLACAAALAVLETIESEGLLARVERLGGVMLEALRSRLAGNPHVREIRGRGLMLGMEMHQPCEALKELLLERGVLVNVTRGRVVRLLPPFVIDKAQIERAVDAIADAVAQWRP